MDAIPNLLLAATLLPLASFFILLIAAPRLGKLGAQLATAAIAGAGLLSFVSLLFIWLPAHPPRTVHFHGHAEHGEHAEHGDGHGPAEAPHANSGHEQPGHEQPGHEQPGHEQPGHEQPGHEQPGRGAGDTATADTTESEEGPFYLAGNYYQLGKFGRLQLAIGYYVDSLTLCMFCMVTLIATCIHFYAMGYMHDEEAETVEDHEITLADGSHFHRPGRYPRFFQFLSLFCFSMLGLVLAGNIAMVFVFWELVGICSYFLIGFYVERKSASTAANKAFIVNRVGDFGMIIGLMALWAGLGTFAFGDMDLNGDGRVGDTNDVVEVGMFSQVRPADAEHQLIVPDGMVLAAAGGRIDAAIRAHLPADADQAEVMAAAQHEIQLLREEAAGQGRPVAGYWLLIVAGIGIFCGCVGKSAQFPLHVWLPDAMEGPTPVSALVHSATMVAAGVYLVGRFFPVFVPEVLLVIALVGAITLFMAATIAITATDIKRVLAYSTISQLGYMMLALGVGGWTAGLMHLVTHAFFKSLLFMCSGSVIHAVHTNEMPAMGGLWKKMPYTAFTMLVGCLAIAGAGIPFVVGLSGYYSKDAILEQAYSFMRANQSGLGAVFFVAAAGGAAITAFYMFRLWFLTFAGTPRDHHRYDHAHESPKVMYVPLLILAFFAITVAWQPFNWSWIPFRDVSLVNLLEASRPAGTATQLSVNSPLTGMVWPNEFLSHEAAVKVPVTLLAFSTAVLGILMAAAFYWFRYLDPEDTRRSFQPVYRLLVNKWWFDELYDFVFVRPAHVVARLISGLDRNWIDWLLNALAGCVRWFSRWMAWLGDQTLIDGTVNLVASWTYAAGNALRVVQTGSIRQYVMFIVLGAVSIFALISFF